MTLREAGSILLVSCYELGHQPFTIASPWAQLEAAGFGVDGVDAAVEAIAADAIARARLVAISVPMHTAVRLGSAIARRVRRENPRAHVCLFGLYAALNAEHLLGTVADSILGGEFEHALVELASALDRGEKIDARAKLPVLERLAFTTPRRDRLPALDRYAKLIGPAAGETRVVGYVEASRGCLHTCKHCPITPVYEGRFFVVPREVVLADVDQQVAAGARHITFGDPDFMNGAGHSMAIARALHERHPDVTFDVTAKVEHVLRHRARFGELRDLGCIFVISAIESLSDRVLAELAKGHTRADIVEALDILDAAGVSLRPSLVAFTPWTTLDDYLELTDFILERGLVENVDPIQLAIRLLIPPRSAILHGDAERPWLGPLVPEEFGHRWTHPDPRMDRLHEQVAARVEEAAARSEDPAETFAGVRDLAYAAAEKTPAAIIAVRARRFSPRLTEPWFCCAEPTRIQVDRLGSTTAVRPGGQSGCCSSD